MKAMKGLSMNKMLGSIKRRPTNSATEDVAAAIESSAADPPEVVAGRFAKLFCESSGSSAAGDEVAYLPPIVESAESSPAAAAECARVVRKMLHRDYWSKPSYQYNAIMLVRILSDNPGMTFTRNLDKKFVDAAKELLRAGRDPSVRQILVETLDSLEATKAYDEGLGGVIQMWKKEREKMGRWPGQPHAGTHTPPIHPQQFPQFPQPQQNYFSRSHSDRRTLPAPADLASRLEEARTSAKLLEQVVVCTPAAEFLSNELVREFSDRCQTASQSIQGYMRASSPAPDNDTMESLIDTNEQLQHALNQHQRAALNARKQAGDPSPKPSDEMSGGSGRHDHSAKSSRRDVQASSSDEAPVAGSGKGKATETWDTPGPSSSGANEVSQQDDDPFRDPPDSSARAGASGSSEDHMFAEIHGLGDGGGLDGNPVYRY